MISGNPANSADERNEVVDKIKGVKRKLAACDLEMQEIKNRKREEEKNRVELLLKFIKSIKIDPLDQSTFSAGLRTRSIESPRSSSSKSSPVVSPIANPNSTLPNRPYRSPISLPSLASILQGSTSVQALPSVSTPPSPVISQDAQSPVNKELSPASSLNSLASAAALPSVPRLPSPPTIEGAQLPAGKNVFPFPALRPLPPSLLQAMPNPYQPPLSLPDKLPVPFLPASRPLMPVTMYPIPGPTANPYMGNQSGMPVVNPFFSPAPPAQIPQNQLPGNTSVSSSRDVTRDISCAMDHVKAAFASGDYDTIRQKISSLKTVMNQLNSVEIDVHLFGQIDQRFINMYADADSYKKRFPFADVKNEFRARLQSMRSAFTTAHRPSVAQFNKNQTTNPLIANLFVPPRAQSAPLPATPLPAALQIPRPPIPAPTSQIAPAFRFLPPPPPPSLLSQGWLSTAPNFSSGIAAPKNLGLIK